MKRPLRIALRVLLVLLALPLVAELAASFTESGNAAYFIEDEDLFIVRKPDQHGYTLGKGGWIPCHISREGLRGDDLPDVRPPDERRILCVGDSFTFGGGVEDHEAWPQQLQDLLGPPETSGVRVLNGGANGWDTRWQRRYLEARALDTFHPDIVVLGWNWNDLNIDPTKDAGPEFARHFLEGGGSWLSPFARVTAIRDSHLYRWVSARVLGSTATPTDAVLERNLREYRRMMTMAGIDPEKKIADARRRRFGDAPPSRDFWESTDTPVWKVVRTQMTAIRDACAARHATFAVAMFPEPSWDGPGTFPGTDRLGALLDGLGVPWVDVQPDFLPPAAPGVPPHRRDELWQRYDPVHPVGIGQAIMARGVHRLLLEKGLVQGATKR